ncbi:hypothetical protein VUR80DRAFT_210 [Thermomyces stellatus]
MASKVAKSVPVPSAIGQPVPPLHNSPPGSGHSRDASKDEEDAGAALLAAHAQGKKLSSHDFHLVRTLGTGTFARVCLVKAADAPHGKVGSVFALKILRKTEVIRLKQIDHVRQEREILRDVAGYPFITNLVASFSDRDCLYMVLDYVPGGEVFTYLRRMRPFSEPTARFYICELVLVLEYLHETQGGVAYRDIKPENLLLDAEGHIKLVDFGFAKRLGREGDKPGETYTLCGTPEYLAPEVIQNKGHTTAVDWWALGILLYEFLHGYPPFWHQNPMEIYKQIVEKPVVFPREPATSPQAKDIIRQFCTVDRTRRLGNMSGGAARVKEHPFFEGVNWDDVYHRRNKGPIIPPVKAPDDSQCFERYPEDEGKHCEYTDEMAAQYDQYFEDF